MHYIEYIFTVTPRDPACEILAAELSELGFDSFIDTDKGINAYILQNLWYPDILQEVFILQNKNFNIYYDINEIPPTNWNTEWEKNFEPIIVENQLTVRATFHSKATTPLEIVIDPKMSFGTGHHQTTFLMLQYLLSKNLSGKKVADIGCGTSILAIMAAKKGAQSVLAVDIDPWCIENSVENIIRNGYEHLIEVQEGSSELLQGIFDLIIANINRNILLDNIPNYAPHLSKGGKLLLSGFYSEDVKVLQEKCKAFGLQKVSEKEKDNWCALEFEKIA